MGYGGGGRDGGGGGGGGYRGGGGGGGRGATGPDYCTLNITHGITDFSKRVHVKDLFEKFGELHACWLPPVGRRSGNDYGYVKFKREGPAEEAFKACQKGLVDLWGVKLSVEWRTNPTNDISHDHDFDAKGSNLLSSRELYKKQLLSGRAMNTKRKKSSSSSSSSDDKPKKEKPRREERRDDRRDDRGDDRGDDRRAPREDDRGRGPRREPRAEDRLKELQAEQKRDRGEGRRGGKGDDRGRSGGDSKGDSKADDDRTMALQDAPVDVPDEDRSKRGNSPGRRGSPRRSRSPPQRASPVGRRQRSLSPRQNAQPEEKAQSPARGASPEPEQKLQTTEGMTAAQSMRAMFEQEREKRKIAREKEAALA